MFSPVLRLPARGPIRWLFGHSGLTLSHRPSWAHVQSFYSDILPGQAAGSVRHGRAHDLSSWTVCQDKLLEASGVGMLLITMLAPTGTWEGAGSAYGSRKGDSCHPQHSGGRLGHRLLLRCGRQGECVQHNQQVRVAETSAGQQLRLSQISGVRESCAACLTGESFGDPLGLF